ncbi:MULTISPECIES: lysophospholipid acyltransferase family protein [Flavobacterium]|nr:lipid A biosynthesis acyltransferase [Flavobacterium sp. N1846]
MQLLVFLIIYPLLWIISILPFRLLYIFSDFVYFMVYHVIGYRKKTVRENLLIAFPHLSDKERLAIEKKSFQHLCDMFLEMIKTLSITDKQIEERFTYANLEVYKDLEKKGKSIALLTSHYASYEWVISMNRKISHKGYGIYKQITNPYFDDLVKKIRSRFKAYLITTKETKKTIANNYKNGVLAVYGFASDQTPRRSDNMYWYTFFGQTTAIHYGAENLAKEFDMNIIFLKVKKIKRGYYQASFEVPTEDVKSVPNYKISEEFMRNVEQQIIEAPEYYLWTHKRWKHKKYD